MIILTLRTDKPEAEIGIYQDRDELLYCNWQAHRELAETIHSQLGAQLEKISKKLTDIEGLVVYEGPGSFTGLRIGITVANTLADGLAIPIVSETGDGWQQNGIGRLLAGENEIQAMPEYGALPHITQQKK